MKSETIGELAAALAKAQGEMKAAPKLKVNPFFKSRYADLTAIWDVAREPLAKNGLAIVQAPQTDHVGNFWLETTLIHSSGEFITSTYPLEPVKKDPQGYGGAITYARRYAMAIIGVVTDDDDDGNSISPKTINEEQLEIIQNLIEKTNSDVEGVCKKLKINSLADIPSEEFARVKANYEKKLSK